MLDMDILSSLDREVSWIQWLFPLWTKANLKNTDLIDFFNGFWEDQWQFKSYGALSVGLASGWIFWGRVRYQWRCPV